jgi:hypothetical protein
MVALVMTFNEGIHLERLSDVSNGHAALLRAIDRWLVSLEAEGKAEGKAKGGSK